MSAPNQGKIKFTKHAPDKELVITFDARNRKIRVDRQWVLFDYTTGQDQVHTGHVSALQDVIKQYKAIRDFHGKGLKLHVLGIASNSARDPRFDNDALATRRAKNVIDFLAKHGVNRNDVSVPNHGVLGEKGQNEEVHRSVVVSAGLPANVKFKMVWFADKKGAPLNFHDNEVQIWDLDWGLAATYLAIPHDDTDFGGGSTGVPFDGEFLDTIGLDLLMNGGGDEKRNHVSLMSFSSSLATFTSSVILTVNGMTKREKVSFDGFGTNPKFKPGPLTETDSRTVDLILAKPEFEDVIGGQSRSRLMLV